MIDSFISQFPRFLYMEPNPLVTPWCSLHKDQLLRRYERPGFEAVEVYAAHKIDRFFAGPKRHRVAAGFLIAVHERGDFIAEDIVHFEGNLTSLRKTILDPRGWIERVRIILIQFKRNWHSL